MKISYIYPIHIKPTLLAYRPNLAEYTMKTATFSQTIYVINSYI